MMNQEYLNGKEHEEYINDILGVASSFANFEGATERTTK